MNWHAMSVEQRCEAICAAYGTPARHIGLSLGLHEDAAKASVMRLARQHNLPVVEHAPRSNGGGTHTTWHTEDDARRRQWIIAQDEAFQAAMRKSLGVA